MHGGGQARLAHAPHSLGARLALAIFSAASAACGWGTEDGARSVADANAGRAGNSRTRRKVCRPDDLAQSGGARGGAAAAPVAPLRAALSAAHCPPHAHLEKKMRAPPR